MNYLENELKLYFGDDYQINEHIILHHPTVGDIVELGENAYFGTIHTFSLIPSDMKSQLWDMGICWEDISDYELFCMLVLSQTLTVSKTQVLFGSLDFTKFVPYTLPETDECILYQQTENGDVFLDENDYLKIASAVRKIHGIKPKVERAGSRVVREILIEEDRRKLQKLKEESNKSTLVPLISSLVNCSEFKYDLDGIRKLPVYAFMDSVNRVQIIKSSTALLQGCYSGMIDTSKIDKKELNWMRDFNTGA